MSIDGLLTVVRAFTNPAVSRVGQERCLRRHGVFDLCDLVAQDDGKPATKEKFKD